MAALGRLNKPPKIGDGELNLSALTTVSVPEMFRYRLQGSHVSVGVLSTAQIDRVANLNTTLIETCHLRCACRVV